MLCPVRTQAMPDLMGADCEADVRVPAPGRIAAPVGILARLRVETRKAHLDVEQALGFADDSLDHAAYVRRMVRFYGFYQPLELALSKYARMQPFGELLADRLQKTRHLVTDLRALDVCSASVPLCRELPPLRSPADMLGCLYVIEGATLGGRVIGPLLQARLGIDAAGGGRFFAGYGDATGAMWQALRHVLVVQATDLRTENIMIASANATFLALRLWCEENQR